MRTCSDCGQTKALTEFSQNKGAPWYHRRCKPCRARRTWERQHPGKNYDERAMPGEVTKSPTQPQPRIPPRPTARGETTPLSQPRSRIPPRPTSRTCTDCGETKLIEEYVRIVASHGWYGRCRACRARRARERYAADPEERERQKARVRRNLAKRRAEAR